MIFATVGGAHLPFDRLVRAVDELARLRSDETFAIQIGRSTYEPQHAEWFRFDTPEGMEKRVAQAEVIVTHGGFTKDLLSALVNDGPMDGVIFSTQNTSIGRIDFDPRGCQIQYLNRIEHLPPELVT